jgi:hypothetical protein
MPKIRDLAISTIPSDRKQITENAFAGGYWMSVLPPGKPGDKPAPSPPPPPNPNPNPNPNPPNKPKNKYAGAVPDAAVILMKQQMQQRIKRQSYS